MTTTTQGDDVEFPNAEEALRLSNKVRINFEMKILPEVKKEIMKAIEKGQHFVIIFCENVTKGDFIEKELTSLGYSVSISPKDYLTNVTSLLVSWEK